MALTDEDLQAITKVLEPTFKRIDDRFDKIDNRLDKMDDRFDKIENRLGILEVKQNRMSEQLTELEISHKQFVLSTNKRLNKLQDGIDTIEEILKINNLILQ